ncbi:MAG: Gfo/Idh/MocA family oxidoreductase [Bacteroidota bacterium]
MTPIKTAILSFGMSGRVFHAPFIAINPGFELVGIWERSKSASLEFYPHIKIYRTLEEILNDDNIELVIVNTPTNTHFDYTKKVLLAGKHAVVEKAFTTTIEEAIELQELSRTVNKKIAVYQNRRWDSDFKTVRKIIEAGLLGNIVEAEIHYDRFRVALSPKLHKEIPGPGAGVLNDLGPHLVDQAICLFGMPLAVYADIRITRPNSLVDDYFELLLNYSDKVVRLKASCLVREPFPSYIIHGDKGSFHKTRTDVQETALLANQKPDSLNWGVEPIEEQGLIHTEKDGIVIREKVPTEIGNYGTFYSIVHQAIREQKEMPVTAKEGIQVMQILDAAFKSSALKKQISLI